MVQVIDNETGEKLGPNQVGEICVKSPFMLTEYLNKPEVSGDKIYKRYIPALILIFFN